MASIGTLATSGREVVGGIRVGPMTSEHAMTTTWRVNEHTAT